jgi:hypothetical protein
VWIGPSGLHTNTVQHRDSALSYHSGEAAPSRSLKCRAEALLHPRSQSRHLSRLMRSARLWPCLIGRPHEEWTVATRQIHAQNTPMAYISLMTEWPVFWTPIETKKR